MTQTTKPTIVVVGLGYVGLPLATQFAKRFRVIGYELDSQKVAELKQGFDRMHEVASEELKAVTIEYTVDPESISQGDIVIAAIPTPVDSHNIPDLSLVHNATATIGKHLKPGAIVVFESTVYPGVTEEQCVPILEEESGLKYNKDFFVGYSPERVNPGDKEHTIDKVKKIVSASTPQATQKLKEVYGAIVLAGIHVAPSIRVAEAAKVIENIQRDINIALVNELAVLFDRMDINVHDVLDAAATKWNFNRYTPGLVGGHCIGVDPYYLTHKAVEVNYHPEMILAGRRINDSMHSHYVGKLVQGLNLKGVATSKATVGVLGLTFKENCSDDRNSRVEHLIKELKGYGCRVLGIDPWLTAERIRHFGAEPLTLEDFGKQKLDAVVIAVPHKQFFGLDYSAIPVKLDIKGAILK